MASPGIQVVPRSQSHQEIAAGCNLPDFARRQVVEIIYESGLICRCLTGFSSQASSVSLVTPSPDLTFLRQSPETGFVRYDLYNATQAPEALARAALLELCDGLVLIDGLVSVINCQLSFEPVSPFVATDARVAKTAQHRAGWGRKYLQLWHYQLRLPSTTEARRGGKTSVAKLQDFLPSRDRRRYWLGTHGFI